MMNTRWADKCLEKLLLLETETKALIARVETLDREVINVNLRRGKLDRYQTEIKENLLSMSALLDGLKVLSREPQNLLGNENLYEVIERNKEQLLSLQATYRKAVFTASSHLEIAEREELIKRSVRGDSQTTQHNIDEEFQGSLELTRDMATYARLLTEEVERGAANAELLEASSNKITSNYAELKDMASHMNQSKRLTGLAYRRRLTERILFFLAFLFFFSSCGTIFLRRIPMGGWFFPSR